MAPTHGRSGPPIVDLLFEEGYRFEFFQAVRLLERLQHDRSAVGQSAIPSAEVVRFAAQASLVFPPSEVHEITKFSDSARPPQMTVAFIGLTGPFGILPRHYTELVIRRAAQKDFALKDFLDLFNHRLISLFYRAWEKYRFPIAYERRLQKKANDPFRDALASLTGIGGDAIPRQISKGGEHLLYYAGLVGQRPRSASSMEGILKDYFKVPVKIVQFIGAWLLLSHVDVSRLSSAPRNNQLGHSLVLGSRVWDAQAKIRISIGPLQYSEFLTFLPSGTARRPLLDIVRFLVPLELQYDVEVKLLAKHVPPCRLGGSVSTRLGWSSWLKTKEFVQDGQVQFAA